MRLQLRLHSFYQRLEKTFIRFRIKYASIHVKKYRSGTVLESRKVQFSRYLIKLSGTGARPAIFGSATLVGIGTVPFLTNSDNKEVFSHF
jgi:hypothetical protein